MPVYHRRIQFRNVHTILQNPEQIARRMTGLEQVFDHCRDRVVWDIGCAEGEVSGRCLDAGAARVTGVEKRKKSGPASHLPKFFLRFFRIPSTPL